MINLHLSGMTFSNSNRVMIGINQRNRHIRAPRIWIKFWDNWPIAYKSGLQLRHASNLCLTLRNNWQINISWKTKMISNLKRLSHIITFVINTHREKLTSEMWWVMLVIFQLWGAAYTIVYRSAASAYANKCSFFKSIYLLYIIYNIVLYWCLECRV